MNTKQRGNTLVIVLVVGLLVLLGGAYFYSQQNQSSDVAMVADEAPVTATPQPVDQELTAEQDAELPNGVAGSYVAYSQTEFDVNQDMTRVLFFHADWCPTCRAADNDINANLSNIPEGVVIMKTDYDTETELKEKYDITYQHQFVQVDADGNVLAQWNGGGLDQLIDSIQ